MDTNITKSWTITINEDEIFARCVNESLYHTYVRNSDNSDKAVMQDDDRGQFNMYFANAIADLQMLLARRMDSYPEYNDNNIIFTLRMHDNHDDNILSILETQCFEFLLRRVLEQWYRSDLGSSYVKLEINHCIHYRKNPVRRRTGPLF